MSSRHDQATPQEIFTPFDVEITGASATPDTIAVNWAVTYPWNLPLNNCFDILIDNAMSLSGDSRDGMEQTTIEICKSETVSGTTTYEFSPSGQERTATVITNYLPSGDPYQDEFFFSSSDSTTVTIPAETDNGENGENGENGNGGNVIAGIPQEVLIAGGLAGIGGLGIVMSRRGKNNSRNNRTNQ